MAFEHRNQAIADWIMEHIPQIAQHWIHVPHTDCPHNDSRWFRTNTIQTLWPLDFASDNTKFTIRALNIYFRGDGGCWTVSANLVSDEHLLVFISQLPTTWPSGY